MRKLLTEQDANKVVGEKFCLIYARAEKKSSIVWQIIACERYAQNKGYTVVGKVIDCEGFNNRYEIIAEAENYDILLTYDRNRLGRNIRDVLSVEYHLYELGIVVEEVGIG